MVKATDAAAIHNQYSLIEVLQSIGTYNQGESLFCCLGRRCFHKARCCPFVHSMDDPLAIRKPLDPSQILVRCKQN